MNLANGERALFPPFRSWCAAHPVCVASSVGPAVFMEQASETITPLHWTGSHPVSSAGAQGRRCPRLWRGARLQLLYGDMFLRRLQPLRE
jgi:hypothetical protein